MGDDMIKINKYLKELGYIQEDLPGHYDKQCKDFDKPYNDPRNQDMPEYGFSVYEFFNLDHTFDLLIYPRLCYFRDHCNVGSPGGMSFEEWNNILDSMIEGFKLSLTVDYATKNQQEKIDNALKLFAEYYHCLWY